MPSLVMTFKSEKKLESYSGNEEEYQYCVWQAKALTWGEWPGDGIYEFFKVSSLQEEKGWYNGWLQTQENARGYRRALCTQEEDSKEVDADIEYCNPHFKF